MSESRIRLQRASGAFLSTLVELDEANDRAARVAWHLSKLQRDMAKIGGDMIPRALVERCVSAAMREG